MFTIKLTGAGDDEESIVTDFKNLAEKWKSSLRSLRILNSGKATTLADLEPSPPAPVSPAPAPVESVVNEPPGPTQAEPVNDGEQEATANPPPEAPAPQSVDITNVAPTPDNIVAAPLSQEPPMPYDPLAVNQPPKGKTISISGSDETVEVGAPAEPTKQVELPAAKSVIDEIKKDVSALWNKVSKL